MPKRTPSTPSVRTRARWAREIVLNPKGVARSFTNAVRSRLRAGSRAPAADRTAHRDQRSLDTLIADCQALARNNHLVRALLSTQRDVTVGHAPAIAAKTADENWNTEVEQKFVEWAEHSGNADVFGQMGFWDLAGDVVTRWETDGGVLVHLIKQGNRPISVELVDVYRLRNPNGALDDGRHRGGVELDERRARPVNYHIASWNENGTFLDVARTTPHQASPNGAFDLVNAPRLLSAGQWRAEPGLASVVDRFEVLDDAVEAAFAAYVTAASIAAYRTSDPSRNPESVATELADAMVGAGLAQSREEALQEGVFSKGTILEMNQGDTVGQLKSEHPNTPFQEAMWAELMGICAALDLPVELPFFRYIRNFHASRSAIATAWRRIQAKQGYLTRRFVGPVYRAWLAGEIRDGRISARSDWHLHTVRLSTMPILDPKVEAEASMMKIASGLSLHETELAAHGHPDRPAFMRRRAKELAEERAIGLTTGAQPVQTTVSEKTEQTDPVDRDAPEEQTP